MLNLRDNLGIFDGKLETVWSKSRFNAEIDTMLTTLDFVSILYISSENISKLGRKINCNETDKRSF